MKGFLAGIGLGTAIGLAIAPETGNQTRKKLMTWGADLAQRLEERLSPGANRENREEHVESRETATRADVSRTNHEESPSTQDAVADVLNSASKTRLRSVPGIGDATARRIIESRPFESEAEVLESKVMPEKVLKSLKDKLVDDEEVA